MVKRNGVSLGNVVSAEITYANGLDRIETIRNDGKIEGADPGMAALTGRIEVRFADPALVTQAIDGTPCELEFAYSLGANASFTFTAHAVYLPVPRIEIPGPQGIQATFDWQAAKATSPARMCTAVLVNTGATTTGVTKTVNLGTGGASGSTTVVNIGSATAGAGGTGRLEARPTVIGWLLTHGPARKALGLILTAAAILLFLLNLRRAGEQPGAPPKGLLRVREAMQSTARCSTPPPAALMIAMLWLTGCATVDSDTLAPCPPVVEYAAADQAQAADEVEPLPEGAVLIRMLGDYAVLRDQARACR